MLEQAEQPIRESSQAKQLVPSRKYPFGQTEQEDVEAQTVQLAGQGEHVQLASR